MERSFEEIVRAELADFIADGRLRVVDARYDRQAFGNAFVTLSGGGVLVRFASDRGDVYGDVAHEAQPDRWYPLQHAIAAIRGSDPAEGPFSVEGFAAELRQHWGEMTERFGPGRESMTREIDRLVELSTARFIEWARETAVRARARRRRMLGWWILLAGVAAILAVGIGYFVVRRSL